MESEEHSLHKFCFRKANKTYEISLDEESDEVFYTFTEELDTALYWSLPPQYLGKKVQILSNLFDIFNIRIYSADSCIRR